MRGDGIAPTMANVKDIHRFAFDAKQNPIHVRFMAIKELPHFKRKTHTFRGEGAAFWKGSKRRNGVIQREKPSNSGLSRVL